MALEQDPQSTAGWVGTAVAAVAAVVFAARKALVTWKSDGVTLAKKEVETTLIEQLHKELQRLSDQNATLAQEVNKLQRTIIVLNTQIGELTVEKQTLHDQLVQLTAEISRLKP